LSTTLPDYTDLGTIIQKFEGMKVAIIGDAMVDRYIYGRIDRISPEAPVPIVTPVNREERLGGAANVALNVKALGGIPYLCSIVGKDPAGRIFYDGLQNEDISSSYIYQSDTRITTLKTRISSNQQQLIRVDEEQTEDLNDEDKSAICILIERLFGEQQIDALILQDYNKGLLSREIIEFILSRPYIKDIIIGVDPKSKNFFEYKDVTIFKPNLKELKEALPFQVNPDFVSLQSASRYLNDVSNNKLTLITLSENGLYIDDSDSVYMMQPEERKIVDVCGAGDAVITIAVMAYTAGAILYDIGTLSNMAGGIVCESPGVSTVTSDKLYKDIEQKVNFSKVS